MLSVVNKLTQIHDIAHYFRDCFSFEYPNISDPYIINPYPNWVNTEKQWAIFGTFSDYVIRKILMDKYPSKIRTNTLIALQGLTSYFTPDHPMAKKYLQYCEHYLRKKEESWKSILPEIYYMSHIDLLERSRGNQFHEAQNSEHQINECFPFFENFEPVLCSYFQQFHDIHLNPILGYYFPADADIITENIVFDIKTVKNPNHHIENHWYQCLSYVSILEKLKTQQRCNGLSQHIYSKVALIFPLQCEILEMDISQWTTHDRLQFFDKLEKIEN